MVHAKTRRPLLAANWKMNLLSAEARDWCHAVADGLAERGWDATRGPQALVFPSHPLLSQVAAVLDTRPVGVGGQDLHEEPKGAHTGDVSAPQLVDAGATWVLVGHSERRRDHRESDELVGHKLATATAHGLEPVLCIGESLEERRAERTFEVLERQLRAGLATAELSPATPLVVAYEPVWAIGTGEVATPETAQEAHAFLRRLLPEVLPEALVGGTRLLYGGSVKPGNAGGLIAQPDVDGFLVGGASLDPGKFLAIMERCDEATTP
jgi:triosephosphate isomerase (TIM)